MAQQLPDEAPAVSGPLVGGTRNPEGYVDLQRDLMVRLDRVRGINARVAVADRWVLEQGVTSGYEYLAVFKQRGWLVQAGTSGRGDSVDFAGATIDCLLNPAARMVATHNHPGDVSLSVTDIAQLSYCGLREVRAVTASAIYTAALPDDVRAQVGDVVDFRAPLERIFRVLQSSMRTDYFAGVLSRERANAICGHLFNVLLHRVGITQYSTTLAPDAVTLRETSYVDTAQPAARAIAGSFSGLQEHADADVYRSTIAVRGSGGMAEIRGITGFDGPIGP